MRNWKLVLLALAATLIVAACSTSPDSASLPGLEDVVVSGEGQIEAVWNGKVGPYDAESDAEYVWNGRNGLDSEKCELVGEQERTEDGWIHWVFATKGDSTDATLTLGGTGEGWEPEGPAEPLSANVWHFFTPFFELEGLTADVTFDGMPGRPGRLVISDWCEGEEEYGEILKVTKTAEATYKLTHDWAVQKTARIVEPGPTGPTGPEGETGDPGETETLLTLSDVEEEPGTAPVLVLDEDGFGEAVWDIDVTYLGFVATRFYVSGTITIENTSSHEVTIASIEDDLGVAGHGDIAIDCGGDDYVLGAGETLECSYDERLDEAKAGDAGVNTVTVTIGEDDTYVATAEWSFDAPTTELYRFVDVMDYDHQTYQLSELGQLDAHELATHEVKEYSYPVDVSVPPAECHDFELTNSAKLFFAAEDDYYDYFGLDPVDDATYWRSDTAVLDVVCGQTGTPGPTGPEGETGDTGSAG